MAWATSTEDRLNLALDAAGIGIWEWDLVTNEFEYDLRGRAILGLEQDTTITFDILRDLTHPEDHERAVQAMQRALDPAIRSRESYEYRITRPDGSAAWIRAFGSVLFGVVGGIERALRYIGTVQDITAAKNTEEMVRDNETRLRLAVDAAKLGVWDYDGATNAFKWSPEIKRLYGFDADAEVTLEQFASRYLPGEIERIQQAGADSIARGDRFFEVEYQVRAGGNAARWLMLRAETDVDDDRKPLRSIGVVMDVTARKEFEAGLETALAETTVAERNARRRFELLVNNVEDHAIYLLDPDGRISSWNAGAERIKGYRATEAIGRHFSEFYTAEERELDLPALALQKALEEGKHATEGWRVRKDGTRFWASVTIEPVYDDGALVGFAKITRDFTLRREAELALEQTRQQLAQAQKMEAVGQLTGGIAHDFNNLLTVILGNLDIAIRRQQNDTLDEANLKRLLGGAIDGARRATTLTQRLLAFSRRQPLDPRRVDPNRAINEARDLLQTAVGESIQVIAVGIGGVWQMNVDRAQLDTALLNLAVNARDAMPEGGNITLETSNAFLDHDYARANPEVIPGDYVMIAVTDTGHGMDAETLARAVEPFYTTKPPGQGTGLGLSQVYGFVKQSGGHFKIYSEIGHGTAVRMYFPRSATNIEEGADEHRYVGESVQSSGEIILVVEDDREVRRYLLEILDELGYRTLEAPNAVKAIAVLESGERIDILLTDVVLPDYNGRILVGKALALRPHLPVIYMTGYSRNAIVHQGRLDPGVNLLQKPITQAALAEKLRSVLDFKEPRDEL